eukprot:3417990-Amphidinium_carterae.8
MGQDRIKEVHTPAGFKTLLSKLLAITMRVWMGCNLPEGLDAKGVPCIGPGASQLGNCERIGPTPAVKGGSAIESAEDDELDAEGDHKYRQLLHILRCICEDRHDLQFALGPLSRSLKSPTRKSWRNNGPGAGGPACSLGVTQLPSLVWQGAWGLVG